MDHAGNIEFIWMRFSEGLRSFIISKVKNNADAEDILQDVFIRVHGNIGNLRDDTKIRSWLYQITRNLITDYFRSRTPVQNEYRIPQSRPDTSMKTMDEAVSDMLKMMDNLPPEYCEALCMTEIEGISQKEYALKTGISYSGAKSRIQRGRAMLRQMLLDCCHYQFDKYGTVFHIEPGCCRCCPDPAG